MKRLRILGRILKHTNTDKILYSYLLFVAVSAVLIWLFEPGITRIGDALWYLYAVASTAGFGDIVVTHFWPKVLSVLVTVYTILATAVITGAVTNYYTQTLEQADNEILSLFLDQLEHLPELSKEELEELSKKVKEYRRK